MFRQLLSYDYSNYGIKPHNHKDTLVLVCRVTIRLLPTYRNIKYHHVIHSFIASS